MSKSTKAAGQSSAAKSSASSSAAPAPSTTSQCIPVEKIAQRAYEKWVSRGCTHGNDKQDWHDAELELKAEMSAKPATTSQARR